MPVGISNLSGTLQGLVARGYPDIGQTFYVVDANYRTIAQGWSNGDRTGPLDLWSERGRGYVFRCGAGGEHATDSVGIQAAIDAMVDFRGDALFFTPGSYSLATALAVNVPDARWLGPLVSHPVLARTSITAAVAAAIAPTAAADRMEVAFLQFIPMTAQTMWNCGALSGLHMHDCFYNADGIAASTSTIFVILATTAEFCQFTRSYVWVDAAQGPWVNSAGIIKGLTVQDFEIYLEAGTWASAINLDGVGASDCHIGPGFVTGGGTALTTLVTIADKTKDTTHGMIHDITCSTVGPAANAMVATTGADAEIDMGNCWLMRADATALAATTSAAIGYGG
mgnify:CR=1 FL=1